MKIQVTTSTFGKAGSKPLDYLKKFDITVETNPYVRKLTEKEAVEVLSGAEGSINGTEPLTATVLNQLKKLKVISRCGTGMNNVDIEAAKKLGIKVFNTPTVHVDAVAELALTGTLASLRNTARNDRAVRTGNWKKAMGKSLFGKQVGLIGFGKVAKRFSELLKPFTEKISYYDPFIDPDENRPGDPVSCELDQLIKESDVISLHIPITDKNRNIIDESVLENCKSDVTIINTSRGGLIEESDLYHFLKEHPEAGVYLDVFETEPYAGQLTELENVTFSPHIATTTRQTREKMELEAAINLMKGLGYEQG
jgi:D-3-phosphoglycerate dehydrogenase